MASVHRQVNRNSISFRVLWREDGKQRSVSFVDEPAAKKFKSNLEHHGAAEALRQLEIDETGRDVVSVQEFLADYIDHLTGVEKATQDKYHAYIRRDIGPVIGHVPITAVTEVTVAKWVQGLQQSGASGKTIANKHGFLSGAFNVAVSRGLITANPCNGRRLPTTLVEEMVFLTPDEWRLLRGCIHRDVWRNLAQWLITTGMRFSEATALTPADIDVKNKRCRINKAFKYTGTYAAKLGPPKTRKSNRTISIPDTALECIDLSAAGLLFTNGAGNRVTAQEFFNGGWSVAREQANEKGLTKTPRVHDLRHTCASWMIQAGVPLPVIQQHLGHESITTTVNRYGHLDQRAADAAANAVDAAMLTPTSLDDADAEDE